MTFTLNTVINVRFVNKVQVGFILEGRINSKLIKLFDDTW